MSTGSRFQQILPTRVTTSLMAIGAVILTAIMVAFPYLPHNIRLQEGSIAPKTIVAARYLEVETSDDKSKTQLSFLQHRKGIQRVFSVNSELSTGIIDSIKDIFDDIKIFRESGSSISPPKNLAIFSSSQLETLTKMPIKSLLTLQYFTIQHADTLLTEGLQTVDNNTISTLIDSTLDIWQLDKNQKEIAYCLLLATLKPNLVYDPIRTQALNQAQRMNKPYISIFKEGQPIIYKGEIVTQRHIEVFKSLQMVGVKINWLQLGGILITVTLLLLLLERFIFYFNPRIHAQPKNLVLVYVLILFGLLTTLSLHYISGVPYQIDLRFIIPIPVAAMMTSLMLRTNISMLVGTILSILIAILFKMDFMLMLFLFLSNSVTLFVAYKRYTRKDLIIAGYWVGLFNMVIVVGIGLLSEIPLGIWYLSNMGISLINGIVSSMVTLAILPYFESVFNITTRQSLFEFSNLNHPLLQQLMLSAPGTYQHSLMVATLAEAGAESIKADPVLCRVGAYFHDIGKIKRPLFFSENQLSGENPHLNLNPRVSKTIIASHVKDGLELAIKYKLPDSIKEIIAQHHGTTMVSFFFIQAMNTSPERDIDQLKEDFRYPGPKPSSREAAIVMLADSVEAASRSLEKPTFTKVEHLVEKIFKDKIEDLQFSEAPLSLQDMDRVKLIFLKILKGIYHSRLDYQDELERIIGQSSTKDKKS